MQPRGEVERFEMENQLSPPADRYRYPTQFTSVPIFNLK